MMMCLRCFVCLVCLMCSVCLVCSACSVCLTAATLVVLILTRFQRISYVVIRHNYFAAHIHASHTSHTSHTLHTHFTHTHFTHFTHTPLTHIFNLLQVPLQEANLDENILFVTNAMKVAFANVDGLFPQTQIAAVSFFTRLSDIGAEEEMVMPLIAKVC